MEVETEMEEEEGEELAEDQVEMSGHSAWPHISSVVLMSLPKR